MPFIASLLLNKSDRDYRKRLKRILGFNPKSVDLYRRAFRHMSAAETIKNSSLKNSNERLEYLGDAVLDMYVAEIAFHKFPFKGEGFLTEVRSKIVSRKQLGYLAMKIGVPEYLETREAIHNNGHVLRTLSGNALEALVGAIYLDRGGKYARKFIQKRLLKPHVDMDRIEHEQINFKSIINQWAQKEKKNLEFRIIKEDPGTGRKKGKFTVGLFVDNEEVARSENFSKKNAEKAASEKACEILDLDSTTFTS